MVLEVLLRIMTAIFTLRTIYFSLGVFFGCLLTINFNGVYFTVASFQRWFVDLAKWVFGL
ncbi:hypothetical protein VroAM7_49730 (plasmid) [Vibrio rotiferianus]|uniref:Uncharacterized protein n=1 Tax=Vibrio rotiferianus TaxID=190895 RepID=A0A510IJD4_9VIBR|nr:hypothetical protein VroAM7_49730 [Vibrio rotiferianus]